MIIYEEILREFHKKRVKYIIVGGMAFNLLGGYRNTLDMDILVDMTDRNLRKIINILKHAGYHIKQPVDPIMMADKKTRDDWIKNKHMKTFNFYKSEKTYEEVDIIIDSPVNFHQAIKNAKKVKVGMIKLTVISAEDLMKMKKITGRVRDMRDIKELKLIGKIK